MNIYSYIRAERERYSQPIPVPGLGEWNQPDHFNKIDSYWSDTYVNDAWDDVIGDYPFENIHKAPTLLEARATDFDTKHVEVDPKNGSRRARVAAMIGSKLLKLHMDEIKLGKFFNETSYIRAKYGAALAVKEGHEVKVEKWQQMITDQADIMSAPRIKRVFMSPSEMYKMKGTWANVDAALKTADNFRSQNIDDEGTEDEAESTGNLVEVFVIEGDMKVSMLESAKADLNNEVYQELPEDEYEYVYGRIICCGADWTTENEGKKLENGIVFYAEKEKKPLQKIIVRNPLAGRGIGESVPEVLFEPQKWWNFTKTEEIRMIAIAGKKLYVTDDPDILANIFDEGVDHGTVLRVAQGKTLTELNQLPSGTPVYQNMRAESKENIRELSSYFQANSGAESKANVPFKAQYLQAAMGDSQFDQYREELGFFYKEIIKDWVLPDALKKYSSKDELYTAFTAQELRLIDEVKVESEIIDEVVKATLEGKVISPEMVEEMRARLNDQLRKEGTKRTITEIQEFIKEIGDHVTIHTTDEARSKMVLFESYASLLQVLDPQDPRFAALVDKVMQALGITKEELDLYADQAIMGKPGQIKQDQLPGEQKGLAEEAVAKM